MSTCSHICTLFLLSSLLSGCSEYSSLKSEPPKQVRVDNKVLASAATASPLPTALEQGWSQDTREAFWFTPQGSHVMPYSWFLSLELADSEQLLRSNANMERYGYITMPASPLNPDALPIGFVRDVDVETKTASLGFTCAACHTSKIALGGHEVIIDGGPTLADFKALLHDMVEALATTEADAKKLERFADRVLPAGTDKVQRAALRKQLSAQHRLLAQRETNDLTEVPYGHGRLDAFGGILNNVAATGLHLPRNAAVPDAPVSYPFVWDAPHANRVQWNGSALNAPLIGGLVRNIGEVLGVFGRLNIDPKLAGLRGYSNSVNLANLGRLENWLRELNSPSWPAQLLPPIDASLARSGETLYGKHCASCHQKLDARNPARAFQAKMVPVPELGTDPTMAKNYLERKAKTGVLEGKPVMILAGKRFGPEERTFQVVVNGVVGVLLHDPVEAIGVALRDANHARKLSGQPVESMPSADDSARAIPEMMARMQAPEKTLFDPDTYHYKARPLNGVWATAPYLHNGSVPSLWDLLQTPDKRPRTFHVGSRSFDPKKVGMSTTKELNTSLLDTSLHGNSNAGHLYGTKLSDAEKWQIIEYVKSL